MSFLPFSNNELITFGPFYSAYTTVMQSIDTTSSYTDVTELQLTNIPPGNYQLNCILYGRYREIPGMKIQLLCSGGNPGSPVSNFARIADTDTDGTPTENLSRKFKPDGAATEFIVSGQVLTPPSVIYHYRLGLHQGDVVTFDYTGDIKVQFVQATAEVGSPVEIYPGSVLALAKIAN